MHKKIHHFTIAGVIGDDSHLIRSRENYERIILQQMRDKGYVPHLDIAPQFQISYVEKKDQYGFVLTMYGVYVGKKKSIELVGFSGQDFISR